MRIAFVVAGLIALSASVSEARVVSHPPKVDHETRNGHQGSKLPFPVGIAKRAPGDGPENDTDDQAKESDGEGRVHSSSAEPPCDENGKPLKSSQSVLKSIVGGSLLGGGKKLIGSDGEQYTSQPAHHKGSSSPADMNLLRAIDSYVTGSKAPTDIPAQLLGGGGGYGNSSSSPISPADNILHSTVPKLASGNSGLLSNVIPNLSDSQPPADGSSRSSLPIPLASDVIDSTIPKIASGPTTIIEPTISHLPVVGGNPGGSDNQPSFAIPGVIAPVISDLPVVGGGTPGALSNLPVIGGGNSDPISHLPVVGDGNPGAALNGLPAGDLVNPIVSDLPVPHPFGGDSPLPIDPASLPNSVLSNLPLGGNGGSGSSPLPVDPSSLLGNVLPGASSVDPSTLVDRVTSNLPIGQSGGAGIPGGILSSLPVDPLSAINPVTSDLPLGSGLPGAGSLPVDPSSLINRVTSDLPIGGNGIAGSPLSNLPVAPILSNLPVGQSRGGGLPGVGSLPVDPSSLINGVTSDLPIGGNGIAGSPLNNLPVDPINIANPILSNLPVGQSVGGGLPGVGSLPVDPSSLLNRVTSDLPIGGNGIAGSPLSNLPVARSFQLAGGTISRRNLPVAPILSNLPVGQSVGGGLPGVGSLPDPSSLLNRVTSDLPIGGNGIAGSPLSNLPVAPILSNLPVGQSVVGGLPGAGSLPVDPSSLLNGVTSDLPIGGNGIAGSPLSNLPVDPINIANPILSNLPVGQSVGGGLPGVGSLPVDPSSLINRVTSDLPIGGNGIAGSPLDSLPVDPISLANPIISNLPVGQSVGNVIPGASSLPIDPSSIINRVTSDLPIGGDGNSDSPLSSLPVDPTSLVNPVLSNLPVGQSVGNGNSGIPVNPSDIVKPIISNLPVGQSIGNALPLPIDPTDLAGRVAPDGNPLDNLPVDPSSLLEPILDNSPVGQSVGNVFPGGSSLPVDPSSIVDHVTSNLPLGQSVGNGNTGALPVDPSTLVDPTISKLPIVPSVVEPILDGSSRNSIPVASHLLGSNTPLSNLPIPNLPVIQSGNSNGYTSSPGNPGGYTSSPSTQY
ncbi:hypothetical protein MJO28_007546 [Puccinia striiformis f. sp. tritici]|uniref:Uncharacterized protein n=1 Tax=Puccinia striiformis f. sp. tritici TaxID=168172 RepID=A0ACC0EG85_9BASI|nr:hypothetical protein MJO28_007546 [Puccinia striiformis f. sp. tritici]